MKLYCGLYGDDEDLLHILDMYYDKTAVNPHSTSLPHTEILNTIGSKVTYILFSAGELYRSPRLQCIAISDTPEQQYANIPEEELNFAGNLLHGSCREDFIRKCSAAKTLAILYVDFITRLKKTRIKK